MQKPADASGLASLARDGVERARSLDAVPGKAGET